MKTNDTLRITRPNGDVKEIPIDLSVFFGIAERMDPGVVLQTTIAAAQLEVMAEVANALWAIQGELRTQRERR